MWNLKCGTDILIYKTERVTDTEDGLVVAQGNGVWEGRVGTLG